MRPSGERPSRALAPPATDGRGGQPSAAVDAHAALLLPPGGFVGAGAGAGADGASLTPALLREVCRYLRAEGGAALALLGVDEIVRVVDAAMRHIASRDRRVWQDDVRALASVTGLHPAMVARALDDMPRAFGTPALDRLLRRELPTPAALDRFVERGDGGGMERAFGPPLTVVVLSGNVFHVAVESVVLALLAKSPAMLKVAARDPVFPLMLVRSLWEVEPRLAPALAVARWAGGTADLETAAFAEAGAVVAYGGREAVAGVGARVPAGVRFIAHGPKVSLAVVGQTAIDGAARDAVARAAAHDVSFYDQQGCVSPHVIYVEGGQEHAIAVARALALAMAAVERDLPRGVISSVEAATIQQLRGAAAFRESAEVFAGAGTSWTVIADPDPVFALSCLNRVVSVKPLAHLADLRALLQPVQSWLQTVGVAGNTAFMRAVAETVAPLGACRICPLGRMQHPPADWRHDGRPRLLDLLRWVDVETAASER